MDGAMNNSLNIHSSNVTSSIESLIQSCQTISALVEIAHNENYELYLVGGFLRDTLLGRSCKDVDFVSSRSAELSKLVVKQTGSKPVLIDRKFGTVRLIPPVGADVLGEDFVVDLSPMRGPSILDDLCQRDFTVNSLALDMSSWWTERKYHLLDPLGGITDLEEGRLRSCSQRSLSDDPLRILRAYRLVSAYDLILDAQIRKSIFQERHGLTEVAVERIRDELMLIFEGTSSVSILRMLDEDGILTLLLPECVDMRNLPQNDSQLPDVWHHSLSTLEGLEFILLNMEELLGKYAVEAVAIITQELAGKRSRQLALKLGVLFHDIGKPQRKSVGKNGVFHFYGHQVVGSKLAASLCSRLCLSNKEINFVSQLVRQHMRPLHLFNQTHPSARALSRFFKLGPEIFWPLLLLFAADYMASQKSTAGEVDLQPLRQRITGWLDFYYEHLKPREMESSIVSGHDIMKYLHLSPGPMVGKLLKTLNELHWEGRISTREEALHQAARLLKEMKHKSQKTGERGQQADCK